MSDGPSKEIPNREKYSLDEAVLTHGFASNHKSMEYDQERNNLLNVIRSGEINSPSSREIKTEYDIKRYGPQGDIPIDASRVCLFIWGNPGLINDIYQYARSAVWVGPVSVLKGYVAHIDTGVSEEGIGVTSATGKVQIPLESGKLIVNHDMFFDILPEITERADKINVSLDDYLSDNIFILGKDEFMEGRVLVDCAFNNIEPSKNVSAKVEKIDGITEKYIPSSKIIPYTTDQLGESKKIKSDLWKEYVNSFVNDALVTDSYYALTIVRLKKIYNLANYIQDDSLKMLSEQAVKHCEAQPPVSI